MTPDFVRAAKAAAPIVEKDGKHTLIIFSVLGIGLIGYGFFNIESSEALFYSGGFFFILGISRFLVEKYKKPRLMIAIVSKKEAIPYTRIEGAFDYYVQLEVSAFYSLSVDGLTEALAAEAIQRHKVPVEIFSELVESNSIVLLFSSTNTLLGLLKADYSLVS